MPTRVLLLTLSHRRAHIDVVVPPMGLLSLAAVLRQRGGNDVRILDLRLHEHPRPVLRQVLDDFRPQVIGLTVLTCELPSAARTVGWIRDWDPAVPVMAGGAQATSMPAMTLEYTGVDAVVAGEGEEVVQAVVDALAERSPPPRIAGVLGRDDAREGRVPGMAPAPDLDAVPLPAWDLVDLGSYARRQSLSSPSPWPYASMVTSRGCPWTCFYCHETHGKRLRKRSLEGVRAEMELLQARLGEGKLEILDDAFNADLPRAKAILEMTVRLGGRLQPCFPSGIRADRMDEETLDLLARARTAFLSLSVETGDPEMQRRISKNLDLDHARRTIEGLDRRRIYTNGCFMLGFPGETTAQMLRTIRFAFSVPLTQAMFFKVVPMPGTRLWNEVADRMDISPERIDDFFSSRVNLSATPDRFFTLLQRLAPLAYHLRPGTAWRILRRHPNPRVLPRRAAFLLGNVLGRFQPVAAE